MSFMSRSREIAGGAGRITKRVLAPEYERTVTSSDSKGRPLQTVIYGRTLLMTHMTVLEHTHDDVIRRHNRSNRTSTRRSPVSTANPFGMIDSFMQLLGDIASNNHSTHVERVKSQFAA